MLKLEEIKKQSAISGIDPNRPVRIVATEFVGDNALTVYYKTIEGAVLERMLFRADEPTMFLAEAGRPWRSTRQDRISSSPPKRSGFILRTFLIR
jgi:hypothetical protein